MPNLTRNNALLASLIALLLFAKWENSFAVGSTSRVDICPGCEIPILLPTFGSPSLSADGRFMAYESFDSALIPPSLIINPGISIYDFVTQKSTPIIINSNGIEGNGGNRNPAISADGRFVAFISGTDPFGASLNDIYIHDRLNGQTNLLSISSSGSLGSSGPSAPAISADGRFIALESLASDIVTGDNNQNLDIFVHDRLTKQTTRINMGLGGVEANSSSGSASISYDGRYVAFESYASNLVAGDSNGRVDIFVHDRLTQKTIRISTDSKGVQGNGDSFYPTLNATGRLVTFTSSSSNLVPGDTNGKSDVFIHDRLTGQTSLVSVNSNGIQGNDHSGGGSPFIFIPGASAISVGGRFVSFTSIASNLVDGDTNAEADVFLRDRLTNKTTRVSIGSNGQEGNSFSSLPALSANGRVVAFQSLANNLVSGDTNFQLDVFARDTKLINEAKADLSIVVNQKPTSLPINSQGSYSFTVTNKGPNAIGGLEVQHLLSNGELVKLTPERGRCYPYASISLCNIGALEVGASVTLQADIKAIRNPLNQQLTVSSSGKADPIKLNNYLKVATQVTP